MTMIKSLVGGTAALALTLTLGAGVASAADSRPVEGTAACTNLVESNPAVTAARAALTTARNDLATLQNSGTATTAQLNAATATVEKDVSLLAIARTNTRELLCREGTPEPTKVTPAPVTPAPTVVVEKPGTTVVRQAPPVMVRPDHTVVENHTTVEKVVPTVDDGSVAVTSGSQVSSVPQGSASTGQA